MSRQVSLGTVPSFRHLKGVFPPTLSVQCGSSTPCLHSPCPWLSTIVAASAHGTSLHAAWLCCSSLFATYPCISGEGRVQTLRWRRGRPSFLSPDTGHMAFLSPLIMFTQKRPQALSDFPCVISWSSFCSVNRRRSFGKPGHVKARTSSPCLSPSHE